MDIDAQVEIFMQGTEYGDSDLKAAMTSDLRKRLIECAQEGRPLRVYCGYDPTSTDLAPGAHDHHAKAAPVPGSGS